jgi:hypothetical protein
MHSLKNALILFYMSFSDPVSGSIRHSQKSYSDAVTGSSDSSDVILLFCCCLYQHSTNPGQIAMTRIVFYLFLHNAFSAAGLCSVKMS